MAFRSVFFDSSAGDRIYTADHFAAMLDSIVSDGFVDNLDSALLVVPSVPAAMSVQVSLGTIWIKGRQMEVYSTSETVSGFTAPASGNTRIDRVVVGLNFSARTMTVYRKAGTATTGTAAPPALTRTTSLWELSLAKTTPLTSSVTSLTAAHIVDERHDDSVCGPAQSLLPPARQGSGSGLNSDSVDGYDAINLATFAKGTNKVVGASNYNGQQIMLVAGSVTFTTDGNGAFNIPFGLSFPSGVLCVIMEPGDFGAGFSQVRHLVANHTLSTAHGVAYNSSGNVLASTGPLRVNFIALGW